MSDSRSQLERISLGRMQNPVRGFLHGSSAVVALIGAVALVARATSAPARVTAIVFGVGLVGLYTTSSLYHSVPWREVWKRRMQRLDHSMIFLLIAASYTPVAALAIDGPAGWISLLGVWVTTVTAVSYLLSSRRIRFGITTGLMAVMGWAPFVVVWQLTSTPRSSAAWLIIVGGIVYTVGMVCLATERPRLWPRVFSYHEVFHLFVITGSAFHFAANWQVISGAVV